MNKLTNEQRVKLAYGITGKPHHVIEYVIRDGVCVMSLLENHYERNEN